MNHVVLVGYLAREVEVEQYRGGHLMGETRLVVARGRRVQAPGAVDPTCSKRIAARADSSSAKERLEPTAGFEPATFRLQGDCSAS